jgi:hypothetical protein
MEKDDFTGANGTAAAAEHRRGRRVPHRVQRVKTVEKE